MIGHGGSGWRALIFQDETKAAPTIDRQLLKRVFQYARPYVGWMTLVLFVILLTSLVQLIPPLLYRDLFDNVIPGKDFNRLLWLSVLQFLCKMGRPVFFFG